MRHKKHIYMRLDGSSKISARRDMVADFQNRTDIFVFLLSTRAGGLGINLTAADTVCTTNLQYYLRLCLEIVWKVSVFQKKRSVDLVSRHPAICLFNLMTMS